MSRQRRRRKWARDEIRVADPAQLRRSIQGTAVGNFMEWYDFGIYGYIAATLAQVFYPGQTAGSGGLLAIFATLAAAFAVRPLGGFVFGLIGDRVGRKPVLVATVGLMTVGTTATGVLPGYHSIGVWAPVLLVVARIVQGFSTGGEYVGSMIYVDEHAPDNRRGMMASFLPLSSQAGFLVAGALVTGLQSWLSEADMLSWGWRVPLLLGAPLGVAAFGMRLRLDESPTYEKADDQQHGSGADGPQRLGRMLIAQRKPLVLCIALVMVYNVTDYLLTGYLPTYLSAIVPVGHTAGMAMIVLTLLAVMGSVVFVAKLSDRIGVKPILWLGCGMLVVLSVPAFVMIGARGYPVAFGGVLLIGAMLLCFDATLPATLPALFPTPVRYSALAVGFNISVSTFGGSTALVAETLVSKTGNVIAPASLLVVAGVVGLAALCFTPEVAGRRLPGSAPAVQSEAQARRLAAEGSGA